MDVQKFSDIFDLASQRLEQIEGIEERRVLDHLRAEIKKCQEYMEQSNLSQIDSIAPITSFLRVTQHLFLLPVYPALPEIERLKKGLKNWKIGKKVEACYQSGRS